MMSATIEPAPPLDRRLDEWYLVISKIYLGRNFYREAPSLMAHLFEVCGAMGPLARSDFNPSPVQPPQHSVAKAVAWWFALCARVGLTSPEDMIWAKFPGVCSHCRRRPHDKRVCEFERRRSLDTRGTVAPDWVELEALALENASERPTAIADFVEMFLGIYGEPTEPFAEIFARLNEEIGELAEAVRVMSLAPHYFLSEAPDVLAWLVRCHCALARRDELDREEWGSALASTLGELYPDRCRDCDQDPCNCAPVLGKHLGRLAVAGPANQARRFGPGRSFLPLADQLAAIEHGAGTITVAGREVQLDETELSRFAADLATLTARIDELGVEHRQALAEVLAQLDKAVKQGTVSLVVLDQVNTGVAELGRLLSEEPGEVQQEVRSFLNGLASNVVAALGFGLARGQLP